MLMVNFFRINGVLQKCKNFIETQILVKHRFALYGIKRVRIEHF